MSRLLALLLLSATFAACASTPSAQPSVSAEISGIRETPGIPGACSPTTNRSTPALRRWNDTTAWEGVAAIEGQVTDLTGHPVYAAAVQLRDDRGGPGATAPQPIGMHTDTLGRFRFPRLAPGRYELTVGGIGYLRQRHALMLIGATTDSVCVRLRHHPIELSPVTTGGF